MAELCQHSQPAKGKREAERGHKQDSCHIQIIPYKVMLRQKSSGRERIQGERTVMVMALMMHAETLLPRKQLDTCLTTQISQLMFFFFLLCLSIMLLLFLLNCHYLNPSFYFLLVPQEMGVSKMLGWSLAVGCPSN